MPTHPANPRPRIVILGGGFGGAYCAQALQRRARRHADVLLIDRHNYFVFYPLLVEAGTGSLEPRHAVVGLRAFLGAAEFRMAEVVELDVTRQSVVLRCGPDDRISTVGYDYLVLALGSVTSLPPVPGLHEYAYGVKSLGDALALHDRALEMLELADAAPDPALRRALLHFVVVGGNFTGVEVAGELATFLRQAARRYRHLAPADVTVTLVELTDRVLRPLGERLSGYAAEQLLRCGITLRLNESVRRIEPTAVELASGARVPAHTVIWCAGIAPNPVLARLPFPRDARGYLLTARDLRIPGHPHVWAIGDAAVNPGPDGQAYPATAQHAVQQARHAAADILRVLAGRPTRPCDISSRGALAALGCRTGVAQVFGLRVSGFAAWWLYRTVYLLKMPGLARKVRIALDWTLDLLFRREHVQLNVHRRPPGAAPLGERPPHARVATPTSAAP